MAGMHVYSGEGGCPWGTPWSKVHKIGLLAKYYDYGFMFWGCYVTYCIRCVRSVYLHHFLRWGVLGMWLWLYNIHVDCGEISFCTTACFKVYKVIPLTILSRVARLSQGGSLRDSGYVWLLTMCSRVRCITVEKLYSRSACRVHPHEYVIYDAYIQELNVVVLHAVIFVPSQFLVAPVFLTPVLVRDTARMMKGLGYNHAIFLQALMAKCYNRFWFASTCMVQFQLNDLISKRNNISFILLICRLLIRSLWC